MRVLLVEDDAATAASIELMLRKESFIVDTTDLGEDGLEIGKLYDYDIIILDLLLPDIDGYQVARLLRQEAQGRFRLIALTGYGQARDRALSHAAGFDAHLLKPLDPSTLEAAIQQLG